MRKVILTAILLTVGTGATLAADLGRRAPEYVPAPRAIYNWTGFYIGANVGGGWATTKSDFAAGGANFATANNSLSGVIGGGQLGYNWQSGPAVFGVETDFQGSSLKGSLSAPTCPVPTCATATSASYNQKLPWFGTVRGRLGYAQDGWMAFVTGGYAYTRLTTDATATAGATTVSVSNSEFRSGWTLGGGMEVMLNRNWSAKVEYLYMDFGRRDVTWTFTGLPTLTDSIRLNENVVRAGVNYKF
jgi:outer membrane immunogenic protein